MRPRFCAGRTELGYIGLELGLEAIEDLVETAMLFYRFLPYFLGRAAGLDRRELLRKIVEKAP